MRFVKNMAFVLFVDIVSPNSWHCSFILFRAVCIFGTVSDGSRASVQIAQSSAKSEREMLGGITLLILFMTIRNKTGLSTEPWGTPLYRFLGVEYVFSIFIEKVLSVRKSCIKFSRFPVTPILFNSSSKGICPTVSKACLISRNKARVVCPFISANLIESSRRDRLSSVENPDLNPTWKGDRIWFSSMKNSSLVIAILSIILHKQFVKGICR